jgi:hypothetical protein
MTFEIDAGLKATVFSITVGREWSFASSETLKAIDVAA